MQDPINNQSMLKVGSVLRGIYRIDSYLSSGGFGNTYVATNIEFDEQVAIKEFFMKGVTQRDDNQTTVSVSNMENQESFLQQREKFKKKARRLRQLDNPHIVRVHDLFEENGTAYYVMDYVDGENLSDRLKRTGKPMTETEVNQILPQILDALESVHDADIWHLDLKPANIMLEKGGNIKLIDFGASKQLNAQKGGATTSTAISYTNGYAPREQMEQNYDKFGPWTDIYALGATLYSLLTNKRPPLPTDIDDDISEDKHLALPMSNVSDGLKNLILCMMKTNRLQRPQHIDELLSLVECQQNNSEQIEKNKIIKTESSILVDNNEETLIASQTDKQEIYDQEDTSQDVDLSYIDDLEETWKDKLLSYLTDLKKIAFIFLVLGLIGIPRYLITKCSNETSKLQKEYANIYEIWRKPWKTQQQLDSIQSEFRVLAEKKYGPAIFMLGVMCEDSILAPKFFQQAMDYLPKQANDGDMYAQCCLGECLYQGYGNEKNSQEAFYWYERSANQGFSVAMGWLARLYFNGDGIEQNERKAMEWQLKASQTGDAYEIFNTGTCYAKGHLGFPVDTIKAISLFSEASEKGQTSAMVALGEYYLFKDLNKALQYLNAAADKNDAGALFNLGCIYGFGKENGLNVKQDLNKAISYFEKSLLFGDIFRIHLFLAYSYAGINEEEKAFEHFNIQANIGDFDAEAQYRLAECYQNGYGTPKDQEKARYWFNKAKEKEYGE